MHPIPVYQFKLKKYTHSNEFLHYQFDHYISFEFYHQIALLLFAHLFLNLWGFMQ